MTYWIFIGVASILLVISIGIGVYNYSWLTGASKVKGEVIEMVEKEGKKGRITYAPKIRYETEDEHREFVSSQGSNPPSFKVGQEVPIAVNSKRDKHGIATFGEMYGFSVIGALISVAILTTVLVLMNGEKLIKILHPNLG